jgi:flagellar basal body-associated protein FliL
MAEEIGNNNPSETGNAPAESFANIPAPTAEIKVRTMRSDLASLAARGGGLPRFEKVNVEGLSISRATAPAPQQKKTSSPVIPIIIFIIIVGVLGAAGWFGYDIFFKNSLSNQNATSTASGATASSSASNASPIAAYQPSSTVATSTAVATTFVHSSLFKKPADQVVTFSISSGGVAQTADQLQTYDQQLSTVLSATNKSSNFIEIDVKGADGHDLSIEELLSEANAEVLGTDFLAANFNPDATFFAYRDTNGFWPGYVIALKIGESQLALKSGVQAIESSPNIGNMFLANAGTSTPSGFTDAVISSASVRVLNFTGATPAVFVYGFFQNDLIMSTSRAGFAAAVARLQ